MYGSETWVLSSSMEKRIEGSHTEFLQMITGKRGKHLRYGIWETPGAEGIREAAGTQSARIYIEQLQATVAQWVGLRPLFKVCTREICYEVEGAEEGGVVAQRGDGKTTSFHPGRLAGS